MEHLVWHDRPPLARPVLIAAFEGWSDAGDAATSAVEFLADQWDARPVASIDAEEFFDFTATRPRVEVDGAGQRQIIWPTNEVSAVSVPGPDTDVLLMLGTEPQLRWKTFCRQVTDVAAALDVSMVVTLGALLAEVPHTRPTSVMGSTTDPGLAERFGLRASRYQGPTGITGVLHWACRDAGVPSASVWAAVPSYVPGAPSPKAALALVLRVGAMLDSSPEIGDLELASLSYEQQLDELVREDEETMAYVTQLEERFDDEDDDFPTGVSLVEEVERFLRDQRGD
ncbi:MAG: PAC2 family protein [Acidimicrobiales bacterium]|nr:PAC2 family protein [Acidimicrobiales bacterium]